MCVCIYIYRERERREIHISTASSGPDAVGTSGVVTEVPRFLISKLSWENKS